MNQELGKYMSAIKTLQEKIENKSCLVGVIGLGYVGLPLISAFVGKGISTLGFDVDQSKIDKLTQGTSYIKHIDSSRIQSWLDQKKVLCNF